MKSRRHVENKHRGKRRHWTPLLKRRRRNKSKSDETLWQTTHSGLVDRFRPKGQPTNSRTSSHLLTFPHRDQRLAVVPRNTSWLTPFPSTSTPIQVLEHIPTMPVSSCPQETGARRLPMLTNRLRGFLLAIVP